MRCEADERLVYSGPSRAEAIRIFDGLRRWKRRGIVEMVSPIGTVSQDCKTGDPKTSWVTTYAHGYLYDQASPETFATCNRLVEEHRPLAVKEARGTISIEEHARFAEIRASIDAVEEALYPAMSAPQTPTPTSTTVAQ